jgi:hypothetical protein
MRCPGCNQRNSVAAKVCNNCGHKFERKPIPIGFKIFAGVFVGLLFIWGVAAAVAPSFVDPGKALARVAKRVAAGPKNPADAKQATAELDEAVKNFLKQYGSLPTPELMAKLQQGLSESAFEVHVFELNRGMSVVEIDTMLQATEYLILKSNSGARVTTLPGMEVFDSANTVGESAAPVLVIIGHTAGQTAHKPLIRAFAVLPDDVVDRTAKSIPDIKTDGVASFAKNNRDINLDYSVYSLGTSEKLFSAASKLPDGLPDELIHGTLQWANEHYEPAPASGKGQLSALYAVAKCLFVPSQISHYEKNLGQAGLALVNRKRPENSTPPEFVITVKGSTSAPSGRSRSRRHRHDQPVESTSQTIDYSLANKDSSYIISLSKTPGTDSWAITNAKQTTGDQGIAASTPTETPEAATTGANTTDTSAAANAALTAAANTAPQKTDGVEGLINGQKPPDQKADDSGSKKEDASKSKDKSKDKSKTDVAMMQPGGTEAGAPPIETNKEDATQSQPGEEKQAGVTASVADGNAQVRVRSGPGPSYRQITTIPRGAKIVVIGKTNGWYKIKVNGQKGFIYGGLVNYKTPDAYNTITVKKNEGLTDEHEHSLGSSLVGDRLVVLGSGKDGKVKVQLPTGQTAFIKKDSVDEAQDTPQFVP